MSQSDQAKRRNFILPDGRCKTIAVGTSVSETIDIIRRKKWDIPFPDDLSEVKLWFGDQLLKPGDAIPQGDLVTFFYLEIAGKKSDRIGFRCCLKADQKFAQAFDRGTTIAQIKQTLIREKKVSNEGKGDKQLVIKDGPQILGDDMTVEELMHHRHHKGNLITAGYERVVHSGLRPVAGSPLRPAKQAGRPLPQDKPGAKRSNLPVYRPKRDESKGQKSPRREARTDDVVVKEEEVVHDEKQEDEDMPIIPKMIEDPQPVKKAKKKEKGQPGRESFNQCQMIRLSQQPVAKRSEVMPCHAKKKKHEEEEDVEEDMGQASKSLPELNMQFKFLINHQKKKIDFPTNVSVGAVKEKIAEGLPPRREFRLTFRGKSLDNDNLQLGELDGFRNSTPIHVIIQEPDEGNDGPLEYKFRVSQDAEPLAFRFKTTDTVEVAKSKVARANGVTKEDVEIMFAGKRLNDRLVLSRLRIPEDAIIPVYVKQEREIMLRTPKAMVVPWQTFSVNFVLPKKEAVSQKIAAEMTIGNVKELLSEKIKVDAGRIDLIFGGKLLDDNTIVGDVGVTSGSEVLVYIMDPDVANLSRTFSSGALNREPSEANLNAWEEKIMNLVSYDEVCALRKIGPENVLDVERVIKYLRYNRNMELVKEHFDRDAYSDDGDDF